MTTRRGWADDVFRAGVLPQQSSPVTSGKQDLPQSTGTYGDHSLHEWEGLLNPAGEATQSEQSHTQEAGIKYSEGKLLQTV